MVTLDQDYNIFYDYNDTLERAREELNRPGVSSCSWYSDRESTYQCDATRSRVPCIQRVYRTSSATGGSNMRTVTDDVEFLDYDFSPLTV